MGLNLRWNEDRRWNDSFNWLGTSYAEARRGLRTVLVEVDAPGGRRWFSDGRFAHLDSGLVAEPRIGGEIRFQRRAALAFWGSGRAVYGIGSVELINADRALDAWMFTPLRGSIVRVYFGPPDAPIAAMLLVARAVIERVEGVGESAVRLVLSDAAAELDVPIQTETYTSGPQQGRLLPVTLGQCNSVPALHTGAPTLRFAVHDSGAAASLGGLSGISAVYDSGVLLTTGAQWSAASVGQEHGFLLNQATAGRITALVRGPSTELSPFAPGRLHRIVEALLVLRRGWSISRLNFAGLLSLHFESQALLGRFVDSSLTYSQLLTEIADSLSAWWWIAPDGVFHLARWRVPSGSPVMTIDSNSIEGEVQPEFDAAPGLADAVLTSRNWHQHAPSELAGSVRDTDFGAALSRAYRFATLFVVDDEYSSARGGLGTDRLDTRSGSGDVSRPAADAGMPTLLQSGANEAAYRATLYSEPRWFWRLTVLLDADAAVTLQPGDVVLLKVDAFGLEAGQLLCVADVQGTLGEGRVQLLLWGSRPADKAKE